jgi:hypothetical protein
MLSHMTIDPNIIPPGIPGTLNCRGDETPIYRPRISLRPSEAASRMMLVMLRDFGHNSLPSGFIVDQGCDSLGQQPGGIILSRKPVVFKNSAAVINPVDLERFVVLWHIVEP